MGNTLPSISIVTPTFNQGEFIEKTMLSVLTQGYPNLQYVIMDGGSNDNTLAIIKKYADRLFYWESGPDKGQADAINRGFAQVDAEVMGWLNSDDILFPGALHLIGKIFADYPEIQWVTGWACNVDAQGAIIALRPRAGKLRTLLRAGWYHGRGLGFIRQESTFWRRGLWKEAGSYVDIDRFYSMDYELWKRFAQHSGLVIVDTILAAYREQPTQKTSKIDEYYQEIGVSLPDIVRCLMLPIRVAVFFASWPISSYVNYDRRNSRWRFRKGPFFDYL